MKNLIYLFALLISASCGSTTTQKTSIAAPINAPKEAAKTAVISAKTVADIKAESNCNCLANFNYYVDKVSNNYAGFKDKMNPKTEKRYTAMVDSLKGVATNSTTLKSCYYALEAYRLFFYDKHLQLNANLPAETSDAPQSNSPTQTTWTKALIMNDLEKRKNALNPIEGVWNTEGYQVGIVFNEKEKAFEAVILEAENPKWKVGFVKFKSNFTKENMYETVYVKGNFNSDTITSKVVKNRMEMANYGFWKKAFPESKDTLTEDEMSAEMGQVQFKYLNDSTVYIAVKSCDISNKKILDNLLIRNAEKLKTMPNWVVDFRNNNGGSTDVFTSLLPYLYTKPMIDKGSKHWMTPDNTQKLKAFLTENGKDLDKKSFDYLTKMIEFGEKNPNGWFDEKGDTTSYDKVLPFPKKVAVLSNENNGSSGETFLIVARGLSDKVTIFGQNSAGYLDYGDIMPYTMPCDNFQIFIPSRRANYLDYGESYDKNGYSPDVFIPKMTKHWIGFVNDYWMKNPRK
jgi:C-terminal processing protease CtpA/Prc